MKNKKFDILFWILTSLLLLDSCIITPFGIKSGIFEEAGLGMSALYNLWGLKIFYIAPIVYLPLLYLLVVGLEKFLLRKSRIKKVSGWQIYAPLYAFFTAAIIADLITIIHNLDLIFIYHTMFI